MYVCRSHALLDEVRILLVHGVLHLAGFDHERSEAELDEMALQERWIMQTMGWSGSGLISAAGAIRQHFGPARAWHMHLF
jgi:hypothetical protein